MDELLVTDACTLPSSQRPLRLAEFDDLFRSAVTEVERGDGLVRLHLAGEEGLLEGVRDLAVRESSCCSFFTFTVSGTDEHGLLEVAVPAERGSILTALTVRAEELSR